MDNSTENSGFVMVDPPPGQETTGAVTLSYEDRLAAARNFLQEDQFEEARLLLLEALRQRPSDALGRAMLGYCIAAQDPMSPESLPLCEAAARESRRPEVLYYLGKVHILQENRRKAIQVFEEGLRADPRFALIHAELDRIGRRKPPVLPFLSRDNAINVTLGRWMASRGKR